MHTKQNCTCLRIIYVTCYDITDSKNNELSSNESGMFVTFHSA